MQKVVVFGRCICNSWHWDDAIDWNPDCCKTSDRLNHSGRMSFTSMPFLNLSHYRGGKTRLRLTSPLTEYTSFINAGVPSGLSRTSVITGCHRCYMFLNMKRNIFWSMLHIPALCYFDLSVICIHRFRRICYNTHLLCIATICVKYCSITVSWLLWCLS